MSPVAVSFILVAAVAHATWNLAAKRAGASGTAFVFGYLTLCALVTVPVTAVVVLLAGERPSWTWLLGCSVSGLLQLGYFLLLQRGYSAGDMSVVYPLSRGTGPLLSVVFAVLLLHERVGPIALAGAAAVVCGVFVIGSAGSRGSTTGGGRLGVSVGYALATGVTIAGYTLWDANAVTTLGVPPLVEFSGGTVLEALALLPFALVNADRVRTAWQAHRREAVVIALLSPLAYVLVLYALRIAPVALVAPARELSIVIGGLLAWRVLGEANPARRLTGAVIVLAGIVALALS
jgi:drug/metabolite transporter (DMT)-like permease